MKKSFKTMLFSLLAGSLCLLAACVPPEQYKITASVSDINLGSISGADDIQLQTKAEGTRITLTINQFKKDTNPFICWIKDYNEVVKSEIKDDVPTLTLTYNAKSEGHYVALFEETSFAQMTYASMTDISFTDSAEIKEYDEVEYSVITNLAGLETTKPNYSGKLTSNGGVLKDETNNRSVICLYNTEEGNRNFTIQVKITLKQIINNEVQSSEELIYNFNNDVLNKSSFDENGENVFRQARGEREVTLNFKKLSKNTNFKFD